MNVELYFQLAFPVIIGLAAVVAVVGSYFEDRMMGEDRVK